MTRRKVLLAVGGVSAMGSAVLGTDAFSSVEANRAIEVAVAGDASALLALEPAGGENSEYASMDDSGQLRVDLSTANAEGVNPDAVTVVRNVFQVTNQGTQDIGVWIADSSDHVTFQVNGSPVESEGNAVFLAPGESRPVGMTVDATDVGADESLLESMTVHASSEIERDTGSGGGGGGNPPSPDVSRSVSSTTVQQGSSTTVTITVSLGGRRNVDVYERFQSALGTATLDDVTLDGASVTPTFSDLDAGGGIVLLNDIGPGTLEMTYTISVTGGPDSYTLDSTTVEVGSGTGELGDETTVEVN